MSRAFVKEPDVPRDEPAYVPPPAEVMSEAALHALRERLTALPEGDERHAAEQLLARAVVLDAPEDTSIVSYGATVGVDGIDGKSGSVRSFTIVAEGDVDVAAGKIGMASPLALALLGKRAGDATVWHRPGGDRRLAIRSIVYRNS